MVEILSKQLSTCSLAYGMTYTCNSFLLGQKEAEADLFEIPFQRPGIMSILFSSTIMFLPILCLNYKGTEAW